MTEKKLIIDHRGTEKIVFPSPPELPTRTIPPEPLGYKETLEWMKEGQKVYARMELPLVPYDIVDFTPPNSNRVLVVNVSDLHFGHRDTDLDFMEENLKAIEYTPNVVGILGWNLLDAAIPAQYPDGVMWSFQTAQQQVYTFRERLRELYYKGKLLGAIGSCSCHEGWSKYKAGIEIYRELFEGIGIPLLDNGGILDVQVGGQVYRFGLAHKLRYWSTLNETHGGQRMIDRITDADIVFTSHLHRGAISQHSRYNPPFRKQVGIVAGGTCKLDDRWLKDRTAEEGKPGFQAVMLWADKKQFQVIYDLDIGRELMIDAIHDEEARKLQQVREELAKLK